MVITNTQIFTWIGFNVAARCNAIINDFLQEGYEALRYMSEEDIKEMYLSYAKRTDAPFPIICTMVQKQRLRALVLWVKDMARVGQELTFDDSTTRVTFLNAINVSMMQE